MKLRAQILITAVLTVLVGLIDFARNSKNEPYPQLTYPRSDYVNPPSPPLYRVNTGSVEDSWPPETSELTSIGYGEADHIRWGGAEARFSNFEHPQIVVEADVLQLWGHLSDGTILLTTFKVNSDKLVEPEFVNLQFIRYTPSNRQMDGRQLSIMAGKETVFSKMLNVQASSGPTHHNLTSSEVMETTVPYRDFKRAVESGNFGMRIGTTSTRLNAAQLGKLHSMVRLVNAGISFRGEIVIEPADVNQPTSKYR